MCVCAYVYVCVCVRVRVCVCVCVCVCVREGGGKVMLVRHLCAACEFLVSGTLRLFV